MDIRAIATSSSLPIIETITKLESIRRLVLYILFPQLVQFEKLYVYRPYVNVSQAVVT
jgi:hypothetical protein